MRDGRTTAMDSARRKVLRRLWGALPALLVVGGLLALILVLSGRIKAEKEMLEAEKLAGLGKERPPANVVVLTAEPRPVRDRIELPAIVEPWEQLSVLAEVPGKVVEVAVEEGGYVKKGDLIARIESRDYENALSSARASHDLALKTLNRFRSLYEKDLVSRADFDKAVADEAALRAADADAELRLERCSIRSPIPGTVNRLDAKAGLYLGVADPVAVIIDIRKVKVSVGVPESDVEQVRRLSGFGVSFDALGGRFFRGTRRFLSKSPDSRAQLYRLEIAIDNPREEILPGMFARADIVKQEVKDAISVPLYAVIDREGQSFVYLEKDGRAVSRLVETGILEGWLVEATKGLEPGDRVVVVGHRSLEEGQALNVVRSVSDPEELFR